MENNVPDNIYADLSRCGKLQQNAELITALPLFKEIKFYSDHFRDFESDQTINYPFPL